MSYTNQLGRGCFKSHDTRWGGIRLNYKGFKAESLMSVVFTKIVLQKYLVYNIGVNLVNQFSSTAFHLPCQDMSGHDTRSSGTVFRVRT
jgi:hypothetical protein